MKSAPLPKGQSQLEVKATLRHRGQVNDTVSVTYDVEPSETAKEKYLNWVAKILDREAILKSNADGVWKTKCKAAERALRDLMDRCKITQGEIFYQQVQPEWRAAEDALRNAKRLALATASAEHGKHNG